MPATWIDVVGLVVVSTLFFGAIAGFIYVTESAKKAAAEKDSELRSKGIEVTGSGIAIKLDKQAPTREDIIDAQSRAFLKGGEVLSRPGVVSAGRQASFVDEKEEIPSAFERQPGESDEQRRARFRRKKAT